MKMKRKNRNAAMILVVMLAAASLGAPAAAATYDYSFRAEEYPYYYPASSQKVYHDGHGNFSLDSSPGVITSEDGMTTVIYPETVTQSSYPVAPGSWQGSSAFTSPIKMPNGAIGHLSIPSIGLNCYVWEGESNASMAKGAGHFSSTSAWDGNVAMSGHNRGSAAYFGRLKDLSAGAVVRYTTPYGTRYYSVTSVRRISSQDFTPLYNTTGNRLTLITCVENDYSVRLCVTADEILL